ncbi:MAG: aminoacetone oxidase family FAD-binding enzyme [Phycisphaerae bacterium]|nr:aminoacetone oxidase family FAD-binding enzyme [Phycisphaerae bacterium]
MNDRAAGEHTCDLAVIGAGAAGLFAAIWAGRTLAGRTVRGGARRPNVVALDGARVLGAKILVAGGGRCNVTHHAVDESAYAGSSRHAIKKVLRSFGVERTIGFFRERGVELKREDTGKLFPVSDDARTILDALLGAARDAGVKITFPWRVSGVRREGDGFVIARAAASDPAIGAPAPPGDALRARRVILATGGRSLPRTGSDGLGYDVARTLGHTITPRVFPALVPLTLAEGCPVRALAGVTVPATIELRSGTGRRLAAFTNSTLCTHFGISGPGVLDISRYYTDARGEDPGAHLVINWLPGARADAMDAALRRLGRGSVGRFLHERGLPTRLAESLCREAGVDPGAAGHGLTREGRRALLGVLTEMPLPVTGDRGFQYAEVTAGGVPLSEIHLDSMESRVCPRLHVCGEICDVDGRIGGFNFQWAWSSGYLAGVGAASRIELHA